MTETTSPSDAPRDRALRLVLYAYLMALGAGWLTILLAPFEHPISLTLAADVVATLVVFGWSVAYDNSSFYDPYWSVIPPVIVLYWISLAEPGVVPFRTALVLLVVWLWGARLTWNWARGWSGLDHEDWRYVDFRQRFPKTYWLVSFGGIHFFPTLIVFAGMYAVYPALVTGVRPVGWLDAIAVVVGLVAIALEFFADNQLHAFVKGPKRPGETLRTGLWAFSRHPNYLGEILFWWSLYLFGVAADPGWAGRGLLGPVAMTAMFVFVSIPLLEKRSLERRTNYQQVIDETPMLIPWPRKKDR